MSESVASDAYLQRQQPLNERHGQNPQQLHQHQTSLPASSSSRSQAAGVVSAAAAAPSLNDRLQSQHLDLDDRDDSWRASATRCIATAVGYCFSPRQMIAILRVLKAVTFCFLVLTILSDAMYMFFLEIMASETVRLISGGSRDTIIRLYGLVLSVIALGIEMNHHTMLKRFSGLKGFLPRSFFLFFIAVITGSHPIYEKAELQQQNQQDQQQDDYEYDDQYDAADYDDAANGGGGNGDDEYNNDDGQVQYDDDDGFQQQMDLSNEIPASAVGFQMVTSIVLAICASGYLICGLLCFDRFTTQAFLSPKDPRITTAIPLSSRSPSNGSHGGGPGRMS